MEQVTKIRKIFLNYELKGREMLRQAQQPCFDRLSNHASTGSATGKEKREERREKTGREKRIVDKVKLI